MSRPALSPQEVIEKSSASSSQSSGTLRVDKWLWHTRLCKTRSLAAKLCEAGQVSCNGNPAKPAHGVKPGHCVVLSHGGFCRTLIVLDLGARRGPAKEAQLLYRETERQRLAEPEWERLLPHRADRALS